MVCYSFYYLFLSGCIWIYIDAQTVIRSRDGDQFVAQCSCDCCKDFKAYCINNNNQGCHCEHGLTYYKNEKGNITCVNDPNIIDKCEFKLDGGTNYGNSLESFHLTPNAVVGSITSNVRRLKDCNIESIVYFEGKSWKALPSNDFQLSKDLDLKFTGSSTKLYESLLMKLQINCKKFSSCVIFKTEKEHVFNLSTTQSTRTTTANSVVKDKQSSWLLGVIIGCVCLFILICIIVIIVWCFKKRKFSKRKSSEPKESKESKQNALLIDTGPSDSNRNSIHDSVAMYVADEQEQENCYQDPDIVFTDPAKKVKDSNYDYPYMKHHGMKSYQKGQSEKHEYASITTEHPYDHPESVPCPESRKSIGYAELDEITVKTDNKSSGYQTLNLENVDNEVVVKDVDSPNYFQLDAGENAL